MTHEPIKLGTRARITRATGIDTTKMLELAQATAPDPTVFEHYTPFFWQVNASSNRLDFYYTRMRPGRSKTLGNFVRGLKAGVSYQDSHNPYKNGWGQSLDGRLVTTDEVDEETGDQIVEAWGDFFTLSGLQLGDQNTNDFTAAIRAGVWRDVSVGFFASDIECGLCGKQSLDRWWSDDGCQHIPGVEYEYEGKRQVAWAWINDGELAEVSQVYEGASPGAGVVKAEQMSLEGALSEEERMKVERRYQVRIATPQRRYALGGIPLVGGGEDMPLKRGIGKRNIEELEEQRITDGDDAEPEGTDATTDADDEEEPEGEGADDSATEGDDEPDVAFDADADATPEGDEGDSDGDGEGERAVQGDPLAGERARLAEAGIRIREGADPAKVVRALADEILRLRPLADDGVRYRDDLTAETLAAGVRAFGRSFDEEQYRGILAKLDVDGLRTMKKTFDARADQRFAKKRVTSDEAEDEGTDEEEETTPAPRARGKRGKTFDPERVKG